MSYIRLDTATAETLAAKLIAENHGADVLAAQQPLNVIDQKETILVKGTPYQDRIMGLSFRASHASFSKDDAEILDFGCDGRLTLSTREEQHWRDLMSSGDFDRVFGPRQNFDLQQKSSSMWLFTTVNGGMLNKADFVTAYAAVLLNHAWRAPAVDAHQLQALEIDGMWSVEMPTAHKCSTVLQISRMSGRVCRLASQPDR